MHKGYCVLKDISSSEHIKVCPQDGDKGVNYTISFPQTWLLQPFNPITSLFPFHAWNAGHCCAERNMRKKHRQLTGQQLQAWLLSFFSNSIYSRWRGCLTLKRHKHSDVMIPFWKEKNTRKTEGQKRFNSSVSFSGQIFSWQFVC